MKQLFSKKSLLPNKSAQIGLGLLTCLALSHLSIGQGSTSSTKPTIVSTVTDNGIVTTTYSNGQVVKTVADGYYLDSAFYKNANVLKATHAKRYWKVTDRVGVSVPVGKDKDGKDVTMFLKPGVYNSLSVTHFWGGFGLGLTGGYQNFKVGDDYNGPDGLIYKNFNSLLSTGKIPAGSKLLYDKVSSMEDFYIFVGPSFALPIGKKLEIDLDLRGGLINTSAPRFGGYLQDGNFGAQALIFRMNSSASKNKLGGLVGLDLLYKLSPRWALGANIQGFITKTPFTTTGQDLAPGSTITLTKEDEARHGGYSIGLSLSHVFGEEKSKTVYTLLPPAKKPAVAYAPTLLTDGGKTVYENKLNPTQPLEFKWKSNSPNPDQEEYLFKLYKADGTELPIFSKTTKNTNILLTDEIHEKLKVGEKGGFFYYTVQSVVENNVFSEAVSDNFGYNSVPEVKKDTCKCEPAKPQYLIKISNGKVAQKICSCPVEVKKDVKALVPRRKKYSYVNYEKITDSPKVEWPSDLPLPKYSSIYEFEVQSVNNENKPSGVVAKYRFFINPKKPKEIRILTNEPMKKN